MAEVAVVVVATIVVVVMKKKYQKDVFQTWKLFFFLSFRKRCQKDIIMSFVFRKIVFFSNVFPPVDIRGQKDFLAKKQTPP